jgi:CRP-like cAMP-binding protein
MSTFEQFLQLPLFKGVDKEDLFFLVPKINLDFENYLSGMVVFDRDMEPRGLVYLIDGEVKEESTDNESVISNACLLSFSGLFGENKHFTATVTAKTNCSILRIDVKSLLFLLRNSPVFLSNYLDLLYDTISFVKK